jgi:hypothetical protein
VSVPLKPPSEEPKSKLIEIAARLTDSEAQYGTVADWLRAFRKNYRHIAVSYGLTVKWLNLSDADKATDVALKPEADPKAA